MGWRHFQLEKLELERRKASQVAPTARDEADKTYLLVVRPQDVPANDLNHGHDMLSMKFGVTVGTFMDAESA